MPATAHEHRAPRVPDPRPNLAYPRGGTTPSLCSRRPYLGEAPEARQELPPTTGSLRVAVSP
jgi:hypothetical protein